MFQAKQEKDPAPDPARKTLLFSIKADPCEPPSSRSNRPGEGPDPLQAQPSSTKPRQLEGLSTAVSSISTTTNTQRNGSNTQLNTIDTIRPGV